MYVNNATIVLDNVPIHRAAVDNEPVAQIQVQFLPVYIVIPESYRECILKEDDIGSIKTVSNNVPRAKHRM